MDVEEIISYLRKKGNPKDVEGMAKYGISAKYVFGVRMPILRDLAKKIGKNHELALKLWNTEIREARILATLIAEPEKTSEEQMEQWVLDFDSWEICDQCCANLFIHTPFAYEKALEWSKREEEFVKRAGFSLMAYIAMRDKKAPSHLFDSFLERIKEESIDGRNYVKKAVNWALRQIGKRNSELHKKAIVTANKILQINEKSAKWIAKDALNELKSEKILKKIYKK